MMLLDRALRLLRVSATCSTAGGWPCAGGDEGIGDAHRLAVDLVVAK
jgi:hypothetical protein